MHSEEIIIADSGPLIGLARIGLPELLPLLAKKVLVPRAVWMEVTHARSDAPGAKEVAVQAWMEVEDVGAGTVEPLLLFVGQGEAEAIAMAQVRPGAVLLLDDLRARKLAERLGLRRLGTVALLGLAKRRGLIAALKPALDALVGQGIYLRREWIDAALREAGE